MDWKELAGSSLLALLFAAMVAKLISLIFTFRRGNLRVEHTGSLLGHPANELQAIQEEEEEEEEVQDETIPVSVTGDPKVIPQGSSKAEDTTPDDFEGGKRMDRRVELAQGTEDVESYTVEREKQETENEERAEGEAGVEDDAHDDWEGVESSELEQDFVAAASYIAQSASDSTFRISNDLKLQFYALYKQATEGPCKVAAPSAYKLTARAKWQEWQKLGDSMSSEEAMHQYITLLSSSRPEWCESTERGDKKAGCKAEETKKGSASERAFGPVFSVLLESEGTAESGNLEEIHRHASKGDIEMVKQLLKSGSSIEEKDSDGRTALHWAADSGNFEVVKLLLSQGAQINSKDMDGQTALHYAAICEWEEIAKYLIEKGADPLIHDNEGLTPCMSCPASWTWMSNTS